MTSSTTARSRRTRLALAVTAGLAASVLAACSAGSGAGPSSSPRQAPPAPHAAAGVHQAARVGGAVQLVSNAKPLPAKAAAAAPVAAAEERFAIALLRKLPASDGSNLTVSPASLNIALGMLENGAQGDTRTQIAQALQAGGLSLGAQNAGWQAIVQAWDDAAKNGGFTLSSANSVWTQKGFTPGGDFLAALKQYYGAGVWQADFANDMSAALNAINQWTSKNTDGKITKLFDQLDPATVLVLANAVYFHAAWSLPFDGSKTSDAPFTLASGKTVQAPTMTQTASFESAVTKDYAAVQLPYKGGRFAALAIMPTGRSLADYTSSLSVDALDGVVSSLQDGSIDLSLPKFTTTSDEQLGDVLGKLGMRDAFDSSANFSAISHQPLQVSQVVQRDYLSVGEKGTEAAAATGVGITATAIGPESTPVRFDHPFLFLIRDVQTGTILFESQVMDPTAS